MKTKADLDALIPTIVAMIENADNDIGESYMEQDEDGWGRWENYNYNIICYEEDGWCIEVSYKCCGTWENDHGDYWTPPCYDLIRAWGEVTEISASHYDEETDEESEFSVEDCCELWNALNEALENLA